MKYCRFIHGLILTALTFFGAACTGGDSVIERASRVPPCTASGQTWTSPTDGATLVCVPAGEFLMGAAMDDALGPVDGNPQHRVYLNAYWLDRTDMPNADFAQCIAAGVCRPKVYDTDTKTYVAYAVHPDYQDY